MASTKDRFVYPSSSISYGRTKFKMPHKHKTSFFHGQLIPLDAFEVLPGDTFKLSVASLIRMSTPIAPIMDDIEMHIAAYFIPNRILFENWEELNGANKTGAWYNLGNFNIEVPCIDGSPAALGGGTMASFGSVLSTIDPSGSGAIYLPANHTGSMVYDYTHNPGDFDYSWSVPVSIGSYLMGPLVVPGSDRRISLLPGRSYFIVWNENYRNQNTTSPFQVDRSSANNILVSNGGFTMNIASDPSDPSTNVWYSEYNLPCLPLGKFPDYFTKCLPGPQKSPDVGFLSGLVPVGFNTGTSSGILTASIYGNVPSGTTISSGEFQKLTINTTQLSPNLNADVVADLAASTENTINALRTAFQLQKFYEKDARGGTRYFEMLNAHFGVKNADLILQRPEYLGEINFRINIDQVLSTAGYAAGSSTELGVPGANSTTGGRGSLFTKSFTEHGWILIVGGTRHNHTYPHVLHQSFTKLSRLDFYDPVFANIGEQPVPDTVMQYGSSVTGVFGYQEAWAEYRFIPDRVTGILNPGVSGALDFWTLSDKAYSSLSLSDAFIYENRESIIDALTTGAAGPDFIGDFYFDLTAVREMPLFSIPGLVDHH